MVKDLQASERPHHPPASFGAAWLPASLRFAAASLALGAWLFPSPSLPAASVTLINGVTYQGKISVDNGLLIAQDSGPTVKVDFPNILRAQFADSLPATDQIQPGVVLRNGVRLPGAVGSLAEPTMRFARRNLSVSTAEIAWIIYQPFAASLAEKLPAGSLGALLPGGDFFEGTIKSADSDGAKILSPIFGLRTFNVRQKEIMAVLWHEIKLAQGASYEVRTSDGYDFQAEAVAGDHSGLTLRAGSLGTIRIDIKDVTEIRAGGARCLSLTTLKPSRVAAPTGQTALPAFAVDKGLNDQPLTVWGNAVAHGVAAGVGVAATWDLPPGFNSFVAQGGLPPGTDSFAQFAFAVYADGKQVFRSPPISASDKVTAIQANIATARTLSLRVEPFDASAAGAAAASSGIWIEPTLLHR